jgi:hypothetical protein
MHRYQLVAVLAEAFGVPDTSIHIVQQLMSSNSLLVVDAVVQVQHAHTAAHFLKILQAPIRSVRSLIQQGLQTQGVHFRLASGSDALWLSKPLKWHPKPASNGFLGFSVTTTWPLVSVIVVIGLLSTYAVLVKSKRDGKEETMPLGGVPVPVPETAYQRALRRREEESSSSMHGKKQALGIELQSGRQYNT